MSEKDPPSIKERLAAEAARLELKAASEQLSRFADGALDAVEKALFGKVGGADEAIQRDQDPRKALRARYGLNPDAAPPPPPAEEDPLAVARAQLEALKRQRENRASTEEGQRPQPSDIQPPTRKL